MDIPNTLAMLNILVCTLTTINKAEGLVDVVVTDTIWVRAAAFSEMGEPPRAIRTSLRHCRSLFPGNGILRGRDSGVETARHIQLIVSRDKAPARKPTNSALFARHRERLLSRDGRSMAQRPCELRPSPNEKALAVISVRETVGQLS
jgi:hypothetical protein